MYEMSCKVRFSETDRNGVMSMNGLLRLFQDVGYAHALEASGLNIPEERAVHGICCHGR